MFSGTYSSNEVMARTGITARQLQWWDERGVVVASRQGRRRVYSAEDLAEVAVICELRQRGFSLQRVRKLMRLLEREFGRRLAHAVSGGDYHLLTDGEAIYVQTSAQQVVDVLKNVRQPMLAVALSDAVRRVTGLGRALSPKPPARSSPRTLGPNRGPSRGLHREKRLGRGNL